MLLPYLIVTTVVSITAAVPTTTPKPAPNGIRQCARSPCPEYTLLEDYGDGFFKRRVESGLWAYKVAPTCNITSATMSVYMDLHYYFQENSIKRTTPIVLTVNKQRQRSVFCPEESGDLVCCPQGFSLQFYIPSESQATAPPPSNVSSISLIRATEPREFYGRAIIGSRPTLGQFQQHYQALQEFLDEENFRFSHHTYSILSYDAPWRPQPHRFEILVPTESSDQGHDDGHHHHRHHHRHHRHHDHRDDHDDGQDREHRDRREVGDLLEVDLIPV